MEYLIYGVLLIGGFFIGNWFKQQRISTKIRSAEQKAEKILSDVKNKQNELFLKSQEKALKIIDDAKQDIKNLFPTKKNIKKTDARI